MTPQQELSKEQGISGAEDPTRGEDPSPWCQSCQRRQLRAERDSLQAQRAILEKSWWS